ncbi:MAG TPA: hypothetical protein VGZ32_12995 [Actinocrinis sp.]|uniref:hypothetical protein n=1 Tax=Actinocrinis sp. TaxID=1920516 RepID=UPI002DDCE769|nr:hypothetical protein [Actinocrinis sp.]HEV3171259.1 hypothetical protein [Actinocrinis sp.]
MAGLETAQRAERPDGMSDRTPPPRVASFASRRLIRPAGLVVAAWVIAVGATVVHAALLIPVLLVVGTASLLRTGGGLVDRLVIAAATVAGALIVAGLLFSVWPWGLSPAAVGGFSLSVLAIAGEFSGRRPRLTFRLYGTDAVLVAFAAASYRIMHAPVAGANFIKTLPYTSARADLFNHFSLFDAIHRLGQYGFINENASGKIAADGMNFVYPEGSHYLWALVDIFLRSTTNPGPAVGEYMRYYRYETLDMAILTFALAWAARWVAGPTAGWRRLAVVATVAGLVAYGQLSALFWQGFDGEMMGLAALAVAAAVLARPPKSLREHVFLASILIVLVAWCYTLYVIHVGLIVLAAVVIYRKRLLPHWRALVPIAFVVGVLSVTPYVIASTGSVSVNQLFTAGGLSVKISYDLALAFTGLLFLATWSAPGRRRPITLVVGGGTLAIGAAVSLLAAYRLATIGDVGYYVGKMLDGYWALLLVGFGVCVRLVAVGPKWSPSWRRRTLTSAPYALAVAAIAIAVGAVLPYTKPNGDAVNGPTPGTSWAAIWKAGYILSPYAPPLDVYSRTYKFGDGVPTVLLYSDVGEDNRHMGMFLGALNHDMGELNVDQFWRFPGLGTFRPAGPNGQLSQAQRDEFTNLINYLDMMPDGTRVVVRNQAVYEELVAYTDVAARQWTPVQMDGLVPPS